MIHWNTSEPPTAPFIASIFNYYLSEHLEGYAEYDEKTLDLVKTIPGYLGYESMKVAVLLSVTGKTWNLQMHGPHTPCTLKPKS